MGHLKVLHAKGHLLERPPRQGLRGFLAHRVAIDHVITELPSGLHKPSGT